MITAPMFVALLVFDFKYPTTIGHFSDYKTCIETARSVTRGKQASYSCFRVEVLVK